MSEPELRPLPRTRRSLPPAWAVYLDGVRIGEIQEKHLHGARLPFYEAFAPHPSTGRMISLELHTELENRIAVLVEFHGHPELYRRHWS